MKATIVIDLNKTTKEQYVNELETSGQGDISRSIKVVNNTTPETIEVQDISEQEFDTLLTSTKVAGAQSDRFKISHDVQGTRSISPNSTNTVNISHHNWGLAAATQSSTTLASNFTWSNDGANVDCVIMDTGIVIGHPEFNDLSSNSSTRIQQIGWGGSQGANFYTDPNGHGTHVAGIMAGRTCGWAGEAKVYSFTTNLSGLSHGYGVSDMGYITTWHNAKGNNRPTIVNMSWGSSTYYPPNHPSHYKSTGSWDPATQTTHMTKSQSYDTIIQNMVNAGIVVVCSAGNDNEQIYDTTEGGRNTGYWYFFDSNNDMGYGVNEKIYMTDGSAYPISSSPRSGLPGAPSGGSYGNTIYFQGTNNGQSPSNAWLDDNTSTRYDIAVMSHDANKSKSSFSNWGTPLTTWAPGRNIMSSYINSGSAVQLGATGYYYNKANGTSMASPQVAGIVACYIDANHSTYGTRTNKDNQDSIITWIKANDRDNDITDWGAGSTNRHRVYMPYQDYTVSWTVGNSSASRHSIATVSNGDNFAYDLSATFRNAASEQLHTVSYSISSGSLPNGTTINGGTAVTSGSPVNYTGGTTTVNFTLEATNDFETNTKEYSVDVIGTDTITLSGGITIEGGVSLTS